MRELSEVMEWVGLVGGNKVVNGEREDAGQGRWMGEGDETGEICWLGVE